MAKLVCHGVVACFLVMVLFNLQLFTALSQALVVHDQEAASVSVTQPTHGECPYPCLPPPTATTICPPPPPPPPSSPSSTPSPPAFLPPPTQFYQPPSGYFPYYFPPPWYVGNAPPPPDPVLPYFPWHYKHPLVSNSSPGMQSKELQLVILLLLLGIISLAI